MQRLRHPLVALLGALVLILSAATDAAGVRACAHHSHHHQHQHHGHGDEGLELAGHDHGDHGHAGHGLAGHGAEDRAHAGHDHEGRGHAAHGHGANGPDAVPHAAHGHEDPAEPGTPAPGCDCGFLCVAMSGPPPVEAAPALALPGVEEPAAPRTFRIRSGDPVVQPVGIPHLLPFSQAPPPTP